MVKNVVKAMDAKELAVDLAAKAKITYATIASNASAFPIAQTKTVEMMDVEAVVVFVNLERNA